MEQMTRIPRLLARHSTCALLCMLCLMTVTACATANNPSGGDSRGNGITSVLTEQQVVQVVTAIRANNLPLAFDSWSPDKRRFAVREYAAVAEGVGASALILGDVISGQVTFRRHEITYLPEEYGGGKGSPAVAWRPDSRALSATTGRQLIQFSCAIGCAMDAPVVRAILPPAVRGSIIGLDWTSAGLTAVIDASASPTLTHFQVVRYGPSTMESMTVLAELSQPVHVLGGSGERLVILRSVGESSEVAVINKGHEQTTTSVLGRFQSAAESSGGIEIVTNNKGEIERYKLIWPSESLEVKRAP